MTVPITLVTNGDGTARLTIGPITCDVSDWQRTGPREATGTAHIPADDPAWPEWARELAGLVRALRADDREFDALVDRLAAKVRA